MATRISPMTPQPVFLSAWREHRGLTQEQLAARLHVAGMTVSRWERTASLLNTDVMAAIAEALEIHPRDLYRAPGDESIDALIQGVDEPTRRRILIEAALKGTHEEIRRHVLAVVDALIATGDAARP